MMRVDTEELTEAGRRLNSFAIHLPRAMRRVDAESGLTPARAEAPSRSCTPGGPRPLGRLARDEDVTSATMCRLVDALCELDWPSAAHPDHGGMTSWLNAEARGPLV